MPVAASTKRHLDDHLGQAEFTLTVLTNFDCLKATPAHESVRAALAQVRAARGWIRQNIEVERLAAPSLKLTDYTSRERHQIVQRRMARLAP